MWIPVSTRLGLLAIASAGFFLSSVEAKLYNNLDEFASSTDASSQYDFVIIGGGTAGSVVASRLTENSRHRVLLIEAGPNNEGILEIQVPGLIATIPNTYDWNFTTIPQASVNGRSLRYQRGFVLGGSSAVNSLSYFRGSKDDYNLWGRVSGDSRTWSWDSLLPYMFKTEKWTPPVGGRDATGQYDPRFHGKNGPIGVSLTWSGPDDFDRRSTQNTKVQPEFKEILDVNAGRPIGLAWTPWTIGGGERNSAASGYLPTPTRQRPNLTIVVNAQVRRVLPTNRKHGGKLNVRTVEIGSRYSSTALNVTAKKEVVLSAGTFGTPHLLLNSGIGEKAHLDSVGVPTIHNLPNVGKGMTDHPGAFLMWSMNATDTPVDVDAALAQWRADRTGPMAENYGIGRRFLWSRLPNNSSLLRKYGDPSSGPNSPHLEFTVGKAGSLVAAIVALMTPYSRGSIKLASNNPFDAPLIDPNYFSHPFDVEALAEGVRIAQRWYSGPVWDGQITGYFGPDPNNATALKDSTFVWLHPVGTASMSARDGVVDKALKVKGLDGLRIVDASVIPYVPTAHTQAPTYILAERGADLIRASWTDIDKIAPSSSATGFFDTPSTISATSTDMARLATALVVCATFVAPSFAHCVLSNLQAGTANYIAAQTSGQISTLATATYRENLKPANISTGIISQPLTIDHSRSTFDTTDCASFSQIIVTDPTHPYVIGTQLRFGGHGESVVEVSTIVTDAGDWLFNASNTLNWNQKEDWTAIPAEKQDTRETLKAAADAYLNKFNDNSIVVPFGRPCARLEGGAYTGTGADTDSCDVGFPTGIPMVNRQYVIDPTFGSVNVFFNFGGPTSSPDSHEFRLLEGRIRYVHTMTVTKCAALPEDPCNSD